MADVLTPTGKLADLDRDVVEARAGQDPMWLLDRRLHGFEVFDTTPYPTTALEEWRYTDVSLFRLDDVRLPDHVEPSAEVQAQARALISADKSASVRVLQIDDALVSIEIGDAARKAGVRVLDMRNSDGDDAELVRRWLGTEAAPPELGKFAALNGALWDAGVLIYVPSGVQLEEPVRIGRWASRSGIALFPRTLIVAEQGCHVAVVEEFGSPDFDEPMLSCGIAGIVAKDSADVQYVALQNWGRGVRHIMTQRTVAGRDSNLDTLMVNLGATVARVDLMARLEGPGSRSDMLGLYFARDDQHFDHNTRQDHVAPHASSDLLYKGALLDQSNAIFRGIIRVHPKAQRTDAYQTNRNLLLSPDARATSLPNLEIEADDVRCSHGATVGQLNAEEMFYLMSRGLSRRDAERLVVFGFLGEVLNRLPLEGVVAELRRAIEARIV